MTPTTDTGGETRPPSAVGAVILTLRPRQWVKNLFVAAPVVFAKHLFDWTYAARSFAAFVVFCALSGAVYAFNDARDAPQDRQHPLKRFRPIAAGRLSERTGMVIAGVLAVLALAVGYVLSPLFGAVATGYLVNNAAYTLLLKRYPFVDVASIACGFLLRVVAGAVVLGVEVSPWVLVCTGLLALMLGFGKRAHELTQVGRGGAATRDSLALYGHTGLRWTLVVLSVATCTAYALYTRDGRTMAFFGTTRLIWTLPFPVAGVIRFLDLALWRPRRESPTDAILRDWFIGLVVASWAAVVLAVVYAL